MAKAKQPSAKPDLDDVFAAMRAILEPYAKSFKTTNQKRYYSLDDHSIKGWSVGFAAVVYKARAVSFYLMPGVYDKTFFDQTKMSSDLAAHRKKAGFFNFTQVDRPLFAELARHVKHAFETWDAKSRTT